MKVIYVSHLMKAWEVRKVIKSFYLIERRMERKERALKIKPIDIAFTHNRFDQWRASKVGAIITFKKGVPVIRFKDRTQYNEFLALNSLRKAQ
jgi:hypothetical protein